MAMPTHGTLGRHQISDLVAIDKPPVVEQKNRFAARRWPSTPLPTRPTDTQAQIDCYTPSNESQETQDFVGRCRLRICAGQDPEKQPEKFTPPPRHHWAHFVWPTNEEAYGGLRLGGGRAEEEGRLQHPHEGGC